MTTSQVIPEHILRFLNALPVTANPRQWISGFRDELMLLLGDVDRVAMNININCDLQNPEEYRPNVTILPRAQAVKDGDKQLVVTAMAHGGIQSDHYLNQMRQDGFPFDEYHAPSTFNYYFAGQAYLGTIFLFRSKQKDVISQGTLQFMAESEPFFTYVISDVVARHRFVDPNMGMFDALGTMVTGSSLSKQEQKVIILQLFGHSYKEMADMLGVTVDGIKHHLKMIHRKTGTRSYTELFAKYFLPRLNLENPEE